MRRATLPIPLTRATAWRAGRSAAALVWLAALVLSGVELAAGDWPQWRGPSSRGVSQESGLPTTWGASENLAWRAPLAGLGTSSPIVWGDRVIVTSQIGGTPTVGGGHPQLARDERALAERETPIGGRRPETDRAGSDRDPPRSGSSSRRSGDRTANGCGSTRRARPGRSPIFTRSTTWRRRRRPPTASACTPGSATARSWRST